MRRKSDISRQSAQDYIKRADELAFEAEKNIQQMQADHQEFLRQQEARLDAMLAPEPETSTEVSGNQFIKNGELTLSTVELMKVIDNPKNIEQIYKESLGVNPSTKEDKSELLQQGKWFRAGSPLPSMHDMLEPAHLAEMLKELGQGYFILIRKPGMVSRDTQLQRRIECQK